MRLDLVLSVLSFLLWILTFCTQINIISTIFSQQILNSKLLWFIIGEIKKKKSNFSGRFKFKPIITNHL